MKWTAAFQLSLRFAFVSVCLALFTAGCGLQPLQPEAKPDFTVAVPKGTLAETLQQVTVEYEQATGKRVGVMALGQDVYDDRLAAVLLAGLKDYDLVYLPVDQLPKWVAYHALRSLDVSPYDRNNEAVGQLLQSCLNPLQIEGKLYGLPVQPQAEVLWYRVDLLQAAGVPVPQSWQDFQRAPAALNAPPERYGVALAAGEAQAGADFAAYLAGFGGQLIVTEAGAPQSALNSPTARQALDFYLGLSAAGLTSPKGVNWSREDAARAVQEGRAAMAVLPLNYGADLLDCATSPKVCSPEGQPLLAAARLPGLPEGTAVGSLSAWVVPLHASQPEAAQAFAAWLSGPQGARAWALNGGLPLEESALRDPEVLRQAPYLSVLRDVSQYQLALPPSTTSETIWTALHSAVHAAAVGDKTPQQALIEADEQVQRALQQARSLLLKVEKK